jgi:hypothetical protein
MSHYTRSVLLKGADEGMDTGDGQSTLRIADDFQANTHEHPKPKRGK